MVQLHADAIAALIRHLPAARYSPRPVLSMECISGMTGLVFRAFGRANASAPPAAPGLIGLDRIAENGGTDKFRSRPKRESAAEERFVDGSLSAEPRDYFSLGRVYVAAAWNLCADHFTSGGAASASVPDTRLVQAFDAASARFPAARDDCCLAPLWILRHDQAVTGVLFCSA